MISFTLDKKWYRLLDLEYLLWYKSLKKNVLFARLTQQSPCFSFIDEPFNRVYM